MTYLRRVEAALAEIRSRDRYREVLSEEPKYAADFSTNDYLALATDSRMIEAMRHVKRVGAGGARLLGGRHREHALLEADLARWIGRERALLFSSGYLAALGAIPVLAGLCEVVYSDALNHACLIDGIRATKKPCEIFEHAKIPPKEQRAHPALVVCESLFGMDGDTIDVPALLAQLHDDDIVLLDEAHSLGVLGSQGAGLAAGIADDRLIVLGTLGKAVGAAGGFIAGPAAVISLLVNSARTFIFDTALPPAIAFAARVGVMLARAADDRRAALRAKAALLHERLGALGLSVPGEGTHIVPIVVGEERRALELMQRCLERGVYAPAIRPPTVAPGSSRLRVSVRADHTDDQIGMLLGCLANTATW